MKVRKSFYVDEQAIKLLKEISDSLDISLNKGFEYCVNTVFALKQIPKSLNKEEKQKITIKYPKNIWP